MVPNDLNSNTNSGGSASNLMDYVYLLWRYAWLIALAAIVAGGTAYFISKRTTPVYQTTTLLLVSNPPAATNSSTSSLPSNTMTQTYAQMITETQVLDLVVGKTSFPLNTDILKKAITVQVILNTQIISVTVSDTNPQHAADIANTIGGEFSGYIQTLQSVNYDTTINELTKQKATLQTEIDDTNKALSDPKIEQTTIDQLNNRLNQYLQLMSNLDTNINQVKLAKAQTINNVTQTQKAQIPTIPVLPTTAKNTFLAAIIGMLLAISAVFVIDFLDDTIKNPEEMRQKFGLPILGVIATHPQIEGKPITQDQPRSPVSESFRNLRTNITFAAVDTPLRRIMVTSPTPTDGKTTVCANLGIVFAQSGKKAVIVDGDMRRPTEYTRFGLLNGSGLSEMFLHSLDSLNGSLQPTGVPGLNVITSGALPPNPAELMASKKMTEILERINVENDIVLVDTPPVLSVTDAAALAPSMDGVVLVAKPGVTKLAAFRQTLEQLQSVGAKILGVVLNDVEPKSRKYGYYYHRYYSKYSYYYTPDGTKKRKTDKEASSKPKELELKQPN